MFDIEPGSLNEYSARYSVMSDEFYFPDHSRELGQSQINKQKSSGFLTDTDVDDFLNMLDESFQTSYQNYDKSLKMGVSREIARIQLPVSTYTEIYWKIDLHNFFHYNGLRDDPGHAQNEIVELAQIMYGMVKPFVPMSCQAFEDYRKNSISFSAIEKHLLANLIDYQFVLNDDRMKDFEENFCHLISPKEFCEFKAKVISLFRK